MRRAALTVALVAATTAWARPVTTPTAASGPPLRMLVRVNGAWRGNCLFATTEIPPRASATTPHRFQFAAGENMWARCYLPAAVGHNRPGELIDQFLLDGKPFWTQAYDAALPADAVERPIALSEVLRTPLATIKPGRHRLLVLGTIKRGGRTVQLYRSDFVYVR